MRGAVPEGSLGLSAVLDALSDPTRRRMVLQLSAMDYCCSSFCELGPKTRLTYHFARLEAAGLVRATRQGTRKILSLRRAEVDAAFPGLLDAVLNGAVGEGVGAVSEGAPPQSE